MNACLGQTTLVSHKQWLFTEKGNVGPGYILLMKTAAKLKQKMGIATFRMAALR